MEGGTLPPGFRFHPNDEELIGYYLRRKVEGLEIELEVIPVIDFYKYDPWELPAKSFLPKRDMQWFFFCPRDKKYLHGTRKNRATRAGYWKATGNDRKVVCESSVTGYRKTLVFYQGRAPLGNRTDWVMHEYRLSDDNPLSAQGAFALCRVVKKSGFNEEVKTKRVGSCSSREENDPLSVSSDYEYNGSNYATPISSPYVTPRPDFDRTALIGMNSTSIWISPELILDSSKDYSQEKNITPDSFQHSDFQNTMTSWQPYQQCISSSSSASKLTEVEHFDDLSRIVGMSPYSVNIDYSGYCGNSDVLSNVYDAINTLNYQNPF